MVFAEIGEFCAFTLTSIQNYGIITIEPIFLTLRFVARLLNSRQKKNIIISKKITENDSCQSGIKSAEKIK